MTTERAEYAAMLTRTLPLPLVWWGGSGGEPECRRSTSRRACSWVAIVAFRSTQRQGIDGRSAREEREGTKHSANTYGRIDEQCEFAMRGEQDATTGKEAFPEDSWDTVHRQGTPTSVVVAEAIPGEMASVPYGRSNPRCSDRSRS